MAPLDISQVAGSQVPESSEQNSPHLHSFDNLQSSPEPNELNGLHVFLPNLVVIFFLFSFDRSIFSTGLFPFIELDIDSCSSTQNMKAYFYLPVKPG